jgi:hypothetical protein
MNKKLLLLAIVLIAIGYGGYCLWVWHGWGFAYWKTVSVVFVGLVLLGVFIYQKAREK